MMTDGNKAALYAKLIKKRKKKRRVVERIIDGKVLSDMQDLIIIMEDTAFFSTPVVDVKLSNIISQIKLIVQKYKEILQTSSLKVLHQNQVVSLSTYKEKKQQKISSQHRILRLVHSISTYMTSISVPKVCAICSLPSSSSSSHDTLLTCAQCSLQVHKDCYHLDKTPPANNDWYCFPCSEGAYNVDCKLCTISGGAFLKSQYMKSTVWFHVQCVLYKEELSIRPGGNVKGVSKIDGNNWMKPCAFCPYKTTNTRLYKAPVRCSFPGCNVWYHIGCAIAKGIMFAPLISSATLSSSSSQPKSSAIVSYCHQHSRVILKARSCNDDAAAPAINEGENQSTTTNVGTQTLTSIRTSTNSSTQTTTASSNTIASTSTQTVPSSSALASSTHAPTSTTSTQTLISSATSTPSTTNTPASSTKPCPNATSTPRSSADSTATSNANPSTGTARTTTQSTETPTSTTTGPRSKTTPGNTSKTYDPLDLVTPLKKHSRRCTNAAAAAINYSTPSNSGKLGQDVLQWPQCLTSSDAKVQLPAFWICVEYLFNSPTSSEDFSTKLCDPLRKLTGITIEDGEITLHPELTSIPRRGYAQDLTLRRIRKRSLRTAKCSSSSTVYSVGDFVFVAKRCWPGMNKLGGAARIKAVYPEKQSYDVAYILGGKDKDVPSEFVKASEEEACIIDDASDDDYDDVKGSFVLATTTTDSPHGSESVVSPGSLPELKLRISTDDIKEEPLKQLPINLNVEEMEFRDEIYNEIESLQEEFKDITTTHLHTLLRLQQSVNSFVNETLPAATLREKHAMELIEQYNRTLSSTVNSNDTIEPICYLSQDENDDEEDSVIKQISYRGECVLCCLPSDALAKTSCNNLAHPLCAIYTPETYFSADHIAYGIENIPKARYDLRCQICKQKRGGGKVQCAFARCSKAYHVLCAHPAGLLTKRTSSDGGDDDMKFEAWCPLHLKKCKMEEYVDTDDLNTNTPAIEENKHKNEHVVVLSPSSSYSDKENDDSMMMTLKRSHDKENHSIRGGDQAAKKQRKSYATTPLKNFFKEYTSDTKDDEDIVNPLREEEEASSEFRIVGNSWGLIKPQRSVTIKSNSTTLVGRVITKHSSLSLKNKTCDVMVGKTLYQNVALEDDT